MQGVPAGFALTALANFFIGKGVSALKIGSFDAIIGLPWVINFVWGALIDRYQFSRMGLRKHWIMFSQILAFVTLLSLLFIKDPVSQVGYVLIIFTTHSFFASIQDASVDALAIAIVPVNEQGRINAFMRSGMLVGMSFGAAGLSTVLHYYGFFYAALTQATFLLLFTITSYIIKVDRFDSYLPSFYLKPNESTENYKSENPDIKWLFKQLYNGIIAKKSLQIFSVMAIVYLCLSIFIRSFSFHLIHNLHWNDTQLSVLQGTWGSLITVVVTLGGGVMADRIGPGRLQTIVVIMICAFFLLFNGLGAYWVHRPVSITGIMLYSLAEPMFSVAAIPILMALCLKKVEASQFTTYMAIVNLCDVLGAYISGWGMTFTTAPVIGFICGLAIMLALLLQMINKRKQTINKKSPLKVQEA